MFAQKNLEGASRSTHFRKTHFGHFEHVWMFRHKVPLPVAPKRVVQLYPQNQHRQCWSIRAKAKGKQFACTHYYRWVEQVFNSLILANNEMRRKIYYKDFIGAKLTHKLVPEVNWRIVFKNVKTTSVSSKMLVKVWRFAN